MSDAVELLDGGVLGEFRAALKRIEQAGMDLFGVAGAQINDLGGRVTGEIGRRRGEVERAELAVTVAKQALRDCLSNAEHPGQCSGAQAALDAALRRLAQAQEAMRIGVDCQRRLDQAVSAYQGPSRRWATILQQVPPAAVAELDRLLRAVDQYASIAVPGVATGLIAGPGQGSATSAGGSGLSGPGAGPMAACRPIPGLTLSEVPLDLVESGDSAVKGPGDFGGKGVSYGDVRLGVMRLDEDVLPAVRRGEGRSYFEALDRSRGAAGNSSYAKLYDAFFGGTSIKLSPTATGFSVVNGNHRLFVARELGITSLPAQIVGGGP